MSLLQLCLVIAIIATLQYCFNRWWTTIDPVGKKIINIICWVAMILIALYAFGVWDRINSIRTPHI